MKQVLQNLKTGETVLEDIPVPSTTRNGLLMQTSKTLVSAGTERMLVDFGKSNLLQKARSQPDKVKQVMEKVQTDGLMPTFDAVRNKLDTPLPLGYCNVGRVIESRADGFSLWTIAWCLTVSMLSMLPCLKIFALKFPILLMMNLRPSLL